ncbi:MAG: signal peptide peptidase SppA [Saprospiraceae bacterium]
MNQFLKFVLASCLGVTLAIGAIFGILILVGISAGSSSQKSVDVKPNTVLELNFDQNIPELTNNTKRDPFAFEEDIVGLQDMVRTIKKAESDKNIKGILIKPESVGRGIATSAVLRDALKEFKNSGKFIIAYSKWYSQGDYYMASVADEVYLHPMGSVDFRGFVAVVPFFKEAMDKIGVKYDVFYAGDFKSATEPFRRNDMSPQNKLQLREFLEEMNGLFLAEIGTSRNIPVATLESISSHTIIQNAEMAKRIRFIDKIGYRDEVLADLRDRLGMEEDEDIKSISLDDYFASVKDDTDFNTKDKVAVVYAEGEIVDGKGEEGQVADEKYVKIIEKLRTDDKVKAIVLRVNSPGGSAMASENIWRELTLARDQGIKVVVSMGDYAASGGYYISCASDSIFAEAESLTGSIGVFNMFPDVSELMNDKLGISFDTVKTGEYSAGFNPVLGLSDKEGEFMQNFVDEMYETFLKRVSEARGMTRDEAHAVAQGRIWSGNRALELGLVDKIGGLDDALSSAAGLAGLEKYRIVTYPKPKDPLQSLIEEIMGQESNTISTRVIEKELGEYATYYKMARSLKEQEGIQFRMPFEVEFR